MAIPTNWSRSSPSPLDRHAEAGRSMTPVNDRLAGAVWLRGRHRDGLLVLFFPYRDRQRWAWASIWLVVLSTAVTIAYGVDTIGLIYVAVAGVMALAQLATAREFFGAEQA